ncbi:hypothetical protein BC793_108179 [Actinoplanes xinjiangensis]|uniref:Uncharacterized protein n=1 Tax=Actinoplanes xinjiangensis TaxID=512350 RepID=A0A316FDX0_9ACTN|nr:hypothetical protein BC793_108179 [Actinoplanes xinjiangensis]
MIGDGAEPGPPADMCGERNGRPREYLFYETPEGLLSVAVDG